MIKEKTRSHDAELGKRAKAMAHARRHGPLGEAVAVGAPPFEDRVGVELSTSDLSKAGALAAAAR